MFYKQTGICCKVGLSDSVCDIDGQPKLQSMHISKFRPNQARKLRIDGTSRQIKPTLMTRKWTRFCPPCPQRCYAMTTFPLVTIGDIAMMVNIWTDSPWRTEQLSGFIDIILVVERHINQFLLIQQCNVVDNNWFGRRRQCHFSTWSIMNKESPNRPSQSTTGPLTRGDNMVCADGFTESVIIIFYCLRRVIRACRSFWICPGTGHRNI